MMVGSAPGRGLRLQVGKDSHLRVKDARISLNDADSLIKRLERIRGSFAVRDHSRQTQPQVLGVEVRCEIVANAVGLTSGNLHIISRSRKIADYLRTSCESIRPEIATNKVDTDSFRLVICDGEESLGRMAIDKLDTEDL